MSAHSLSQQSCQACSSSTTALTQDEIDRLCGQLDGWHYAEHSISKTYHFKDYYQTIAFVNTIAWLSHRENHHPELAVSYDQCRISYTTHAIHGLSQNDFICAAKVDAFLIC